jgi:uncharacterized membrane protein YebE (DUF533 family)
MAVTETASRLTPYVEQLLEDEAARNNLRRGAGKLRDAYDRSQKRRVKATRDEKLRRQIKTAAQSLGAGASAVVRGAEKPKRRRRGLALKLGALAAIGGGIALAASEDLRSALFGSRSTPEPAASAPEPAAPTPDGSPS